MGMRSPICALLALVLAGCGARQPSRSVLPAGTSDVRCVNLASGAAWTIHLDDAGKRADGQPARMPAGRIDWRSASDAGLYELDRLSGRLTVTRASSTGGYIIIYRCAATAPPPARGGD